MRLEFDQLDSDINHDSVRAVKNKHAPAAIEQWSSELGNIAAVKSEKSAKFDEKEQKKLILEQWS